MREGEVSEGDSSQWLNWWPRRKTEKIRRNPRAGKVDHQSRCSVFSRKRNLKTPMKLKLTDCLERRRRWTWRLDIREEFKWWGMGFRPSLISIFKFQKQRMRNRSWKIQVSYSNEGEADLLRILLWLSKIRFKLDPRWLQKFRSRQKAMGKVKNPLKSKSRQRSRWSRSRQTILSEERERLEAITQDTGKLLLQHFLLPRESDRS